MSGSPVPWMAKRYWPVGEEPPRLADGSIDIRELCRRWDALFNEGPPN
jgi:hypothetical protein